MPQFIFDRREKVTLKAKGAHCIDAPILISDNSAERVCLDQGSAKSIVVKSRKTKPINLGITASLVVVLIPVVILAIRLVSDSATRDYVSARLCQIVNIKQEAIKYFSMSLSKRPDSIILKERADAYAAINDLTHQRDDLLQLIKLNSKHSDIYERAAVLEAHFGNISSASTIYRQYSMQRSTYGSYYYTEDAIYNLILLGDTSSGRRLLDTIEGAKQKILLALIYREDGEQEKSKEAISSLPDEYVSAFRDSRSKYEAKAVSPCVQALLHLDKAEPKEARKLIEEARSRFRYRNNLSEPILDVLEGWLMLQEGRENECLKLTESTLKEKRLQDSVAGLNCKAAMHLIRKNVFLQQKKEAQAANEERLYKETGCSGRLLTPICFR
jgi:tetratricopeptide (TPR) repeat protein